MVRRLGPLLLLCALLLPCVAVAAPYSEFNPDYAQSLLVASAPGTLSQVFLPLNEYLAAVDVWLSNDSTAGEATFTLHSPTGALLATRTLTIPAIADSETGTRFTVTLPGQLAVGGSLPYRLQVTSAVPTLRLYYAQQNRILPHNGVPQAAYTGGLARIGDEDQGYSFKFALSENSEASPPQLSNLVVSQPELGTALISFNANEPVDAQVQYNVAVVGYTGQYTSCLSGLTACSVTLPVTPGTDYSYTLTVRDVWGNLVSVNGQFTADGVSSTDTPTPTASSGTPTATPSPTPTADTTKPIITNARAANIGTGTTTIAWTTDEAANGTVAVFTLPFLTFAAGKSDNTLELEHAITVSNLQQDSAYHVVITTSDGSGNTASAAFDFLTTRPTPTPDGNNPTPTPSGTTAVPTPTPTTSISTPDGSGGQDVQWPTPAGGTPTDGYRIDIIGSDGKLIRTIRTADTHAHIGAVPDGATVIVYGDNGGVYEKVSEPKKVRHVGTFERLVTLAPYILGGLVLAVGAVVGVLQIRAKRKAAAATQPANSGQTTI